MGKLGENVPLLIDKAVDFMASSQAFREYLKKLPPRNAIPSGIPDSVPLYLQRLEYYRRLYRPKQVEGQ
ncbi:protein YibT [Escherichia coli]|uniref:protein YibT n=1 Tax=Escherichia coli TaxID=562 RepID=UPI000BE16864|nr:protein YibT [Escherichia coli]